ncbi:nitrite/sulfite reductase [Streptomyces spinoverrucosus]|uniref:nitrite/sulfite reductase n=1 Tax=Streptomyces spinoverrucosus TaxID=284043 RepID=UPI0018C3BAC3|nr:nitrite/sulfite reductase [Streptomyces spinoverrucosus]MBG0851754.1 nitrite/sulfite reductase [Streptomyces spinoverrucosus]
MSESVTTSVPPPARSPGARSEGQWALGERAPLNANEEFKQREDPLRVRERIETVYSRTGFAGIDPDDLRGRFRWWGLYTQRKPGIDGGRTAVLAPEELEDEYFMLRVRVDGGRLDAAQLRAVADVSMRFARNTADITDRQNIQLHWVRIEDVPAIWRRLESVGLSTTEACGDCPRVVMGSPVAGVAATELLDATPAVQEIVDRSVGDPSLSNLPRKFKSAVAWLPDVPYEVNDIAFLGAVHPEHGPGFGVWVGGGLSAQPMLAKSLGVWVPLAEVPDVWLGVARLFRDYGYRRLRNRARLKFLVADWGVDRFREVLEKEYLHRPLHDGPPPQLPERPVDHVGVHPQRDGRWYVGAAPVVGRISGTRLAALADAAEEHGSGRVRLTPYQKLLVLDVADPEPLVGALREIRLEADPSSWRRGTMACTGIEYCKLAIVETKERAAALVAELERRLAGQPLDLAVNVNGCPNSCARTQVADIGLKGQLVPGPDGTPVEGFQVHLGGGLTLAEDQDSVFGRKLRGLKTTAADLPDYVERLSRRYLEGRRDEAETFGRWVARAADDDLR